MSTEGGATELVCEVPGRPDLRVWKPGVLEPGLAPDEVRVWVIELDGGLNPGDDDETAEPGPELVLLAADEQVRASRFIRARDRRRFVSCRAALRQILGGLLEASPGSLQFRAGGQGKPELVPEPACDQPRDCRHPLRFNVSHSAELALIAVCRGRELGVDIERVRPIAEADRIVASFFSTAEQAAFASIPDEAKARTFLRGWTRKEAVLKGLGIGLAGLAAHYETGFGTSELTSRFTPATPAPRVDQWQLWEAIPGAGFVASLAIHAPAPTVPPPPTQTANLGVSLPNTARRP
jgi:4'-phosphopantetheinyl transferase